MRQWSFAGKLTESEQAKGFLPEGWLYTLPSEDQWEYACRAGDANTVCFWKFLDQRAGKLRRHLPLWRSRSRPVPETDR